MLNKVVAAAAVAAAHENLVPQIEYTAGAVHVERPCAAYVAPHIAAPLNFDQELTRAPPSPGQPLEPRERQTYYSATHTESMGFLHIG